VTSVFSVADVFLQPDFHPFMNRETFQEGSVARDDLAAVSHDFFDRGIGPILVVMEQPQLPHPGIQGQPQGIFISGVPPGFLVPVFFLGELRIMNEQVCLGGKFHIIFEIQSSRVFKAQLIIREKDKAPAVLNQLISDPGVGMTGYDGGHRQGFNGKAIFAGLLLSNIGLNIDKIDREVGGRHDLGDHFSHRVLGKRAPEHTNRSFFPIDGSKKGKPHNMIPMSMGEEKMIAKSTFLEEAISQSPDPRTRVNDDDLIFPGADFHAGGVSPVPQVFRPANRDRPSRAPAPNDHFLLHPS
jgi:hypothetical protein